MAHPLSQRPTYTRNQLAQYVHRINGPNSPHTLESLEADIATDPLAALATLQKKQLAGIPWGNTAMHYSAHKTLSLEPDALFAKIVERGLGGYCMENNSFFATVLRSLGYDLYITGARVSNVVEMNGKDPEGFGGCEHMVILVTIAGQKYHVDVGFGSQGALEPIALLPGTTVPSRTQKLWLFETRNATSQTWNPGYCFSELEFLPEDFATFSFRTSRDPRSWFTYRLVVTRVLLDEEGTGEVRGSVSMMGDAVSRRVGGGASEVVEKCASERERVAALERWFGVTLLAEEVRGIVGMVTEIRPTMVGV